VPNTLKYDVMVENALRDVVRQALKAIQENGPPGEHCFYITFRSKYPGVVMPENLRAKYSEEMMIVLQNQFWDLKVYDSHFEVGLSFNNVQEHLVIPFDSICLFTDPSVTFGLKFSVEIPLPSVATTDFAPEDNIIRQPEDANNETTDDTKNIISLDRFRKN
jgi:hypothetical protein